MDVFRAMGSLLWSRRAHPKRQLEALYGIQAVVEFDPGGHVLYANAPFLALMGYELDTLRGQHHRVFLDLAEHDERAYQAFWERLRSGAAYVGRCKRRNGAGQEVWLQANYSPVLNRRGRVVRIVKYAMDISAEVLRDAEAASQLAAVDRAQAVIEFTLDGHILRCNRNFLEAMGYASEDELVGRHHSMFVTPQERQSREYGAFWERLAQGEYHRGQFRRVGRAGNDVWIEANYSPVVNQSGQPFKVVKYATDITARYEATVLVQQAFEQLQQLVHDGAERARGAHTHTRAVTAAAQTGEQAIGGAIQSMERISTDSSRIGEMVGLIDGLAFQTNLLALNAAVEAARAGEQGRGFAVVAGEVRELARRSATAAREIKAVIGASAGSVQDGNARVQESGRAIRQMREAAQQASEIMDGIVHAARTQDARLGAVRHAMGQLESAVVRG